MTTRSTTSSLERLRGLPSGSVGFVLVGASAAAVHYVVALILHALLGVSPGWANFLAFCTAFPVSYVGHRVLSFPQTRAPHMQALPRFAAIALSSFFGNQVLMLTLVNKLLWPFWFALGFALVAVAVSTFLLSKYWAFR